MLGGFWIGGRADTLTEAVRVGRRGGRIVLLGAFSEHKPVDLGRLMMKELTLLGFFTSEIGMTQALRYIESPGRYDPCARLAPGDRAWAAHA